MHRLRHHSSEKVHAQPLPPSPFQGEGRGEVDQVLRDTTADPHPTLWRTKPRQCADAPAGNRRRSRCAVCQSSEPFGAVRST